MSFSLIATRRFLSQAERLPEPIYLQLKKKILFLEKNPRHPSLNTHEVKNATGSGGGKVFEGYVNKQYRFTWEYGSTKSEIILRNVDNHDECLKSP